MPTIAGQKGKISEFCLLLNKGLIFTGLTKKILSTQQATGGIFFFCFSLSHKWSSWTFNVSLWPLYFCAAIVLNYNFSTPAWFYCSAYLHDRADREKHYVLLWSVDVCLTHIWFGRNIYLTFVSSAPRKHCLQEWASQLNSLHKLVVPAAPL